MKADEIIKSCEESIMWMKYKGWDDWESSANSLQEIINIMNEYKSLKSMKDSIIKIINCKAPAAGKYDMIVDEVMEHETFGCGED